MWKVEISRRINVVPNACFVKSSRAQTIRSPCPVITQHYRNVAGKILCVSAVNYWSMSYALLTAQAIAHGEKGLWTHEVGVYSSFLGQSHFVSTHDPLQYWNFCHDLRDNAKVKCNRIFHRTSTRYLSIVWRMHVLCTRSDPSLGLPFPSFVAAAL